MNFPLVFVLQRSRLWLAKAKLCLFLLHPEFEFQGREKGKQQLAASQQQQ